MKTLKVINNDLVYIESEGSADTNPNRGRLVMLEGLDALRQILGNRLRMHLGEWYLAPEAGVDWFGLVDEKSFFRPGFLAAIKKAILGEPAVTKIISLDASFDRKTRTVTVEFEVESNLGIVSGSISNGDA
ncbi:hypothetical protein [Leptospira saintgironsiae]|uniref:DUF2634 domain-containing protein n=1 Tax=Leptospira saintgironsiae TaxID=2023183 RepID=A0A2M9YCH6_9LEPT|nr:hypothetical protein [Leptospira saintgironsiae]PJZ49219.1 hypothetical protein CH362_07705 [Leptospira saintgironsiae]